MLLVYVYGSGSGSLVSTLGHKEGEIYVRSVSFTPDGRCITTPGQDKLIKVRIFVENLLVLYNNCRSRIIAVPGFIRL